jgi:DNA-binding NtrC family response regulator
MRLADTTISIQSERPDPRELHGPFLFLALEGGRPCAAPGRWPLAGVKTVQFGRARERMVEEIRSGDEVHLILRVPDPTVSSVHAELRRAGGGWEVVDAGSLNGTMLNGQRRSSCLLGDGNLLEMGSTLFLFRRALPNRIGPEEHQHAQFPGTQTLIPSLQVEFESVREVARSSISICIGGESGTGKELLARAIHHISGRPGPLVAFNCAAVPANLIASELFGFRRGAFSGAEEDRPGLIRSAQKGTLFLDEVGELAPESQAALLRVLQEREVLPLGSTQPVKVDVRFVCASNQDLSALVAAGRFRADLYARLAGFTYRLPRLAERREDLGLIIAELLRRHAGERASAVTVAIGAARALWSYPFPSNVRELENAIVAALVLARGDQIALSHLPPEIRAHGERATPSNGAPPAHPPSHPQAQLRARLLVLLEVHRGNLSAVARELGKERAQVHRWLRRFGLDPRSFRRGRPPLPPGFPDR